METISGSRKKGGRPAKTIKREIRAAVRFSNYEYYIVKEKAREAGLTPSAYIRQAAIKAKILQRISTDQVELIRQLTGMSNNINQVARACQREGMYESMKYFADCRDKFDTLLKILKP